MHRVIVEYDTEDSGEIYQIKPENVVLLGQHPVEIQDGNRAIYEFSFDPSGKIFDDLDNGAWCFYSCRTEFIKDNPFDGMTREEVDLAVDRIRLAAINGTPQDLPHEIHAWNSPDSSGPSEKAKESLEPGL